MGERPLGTATGGPKRLQVKTKADILGRTAQIRRDEAKPGAVGSDSQMAEVKIEVLVDIRDLLEQIAKKMTR
jgi:hypothetical protein